MSRIRGVARQIGVGLSFGLLLGCGDEMPTFTGGDRLPDEAVPVTIEHIFTAEEFLVDAVSFRGRTTADDFNRLLVARDFGGELNARVLARFTDFPDTVDVQGTLNDSFRYISGEVRSVVPDTLAASEEVLSIELWTVEEPWDTLDVSWENAVDRPGEEVAWSEPGGSPGTRLFTTVWRRSNEGAEADSLVWAISGETLTGLASGEIPGLMVRMETLDSQMVIAPLSIEASIIADSHPDTVVVETITTVHQTFIFSPEDLPAPTDVLRAGGTTSDRSLLRLLVDLPLPACPEADPACGQLSPADVSLNRVDLLLDPVPVTGGFRPVGQFQMNAWRVTEPELGERAPLASIADIHLIPGTRFSPEGLQTIPFNMTTAVTFSLARGRDTLGIALHVEPEASTFGYAWFDRNPRLRFVYTLPPSPALP